MGLNAQDKTAGKPFWTYGIRGEAPSYRDVASHLRLRAGGTRMSRLPDRKIGAGAKAVALLPGHWGALGGVGGNGHAFPPTRQRGETG